MRIWILFECIQFGGDRVGYIYYFTNIDKNLDSIFGSKRVLNTKK